MGPPHSGVVVEAHLNSQEPPLARVATSLIFQRVGPIPDKTLQEAPHLPYPTPLDQTILVVACLHHHSPEGTGPAHLLHLHLLVSHQGGTGLSLRRRLGQDQDFLHLLTHHRTTADLPFHYLLVGGLHFPMTDPRHRRLLWEVTGHLCSAMCPLLLLPLSTPNRPPPCHPLLPLGPQLVGVRPLYRRADRALLLSHPPRLEETTTVPLDSLKGTAHSTGTSKVLFVFAIYPHLSE